MLLSAVFFEIFEYSDATNPLAVSGTLFVPHVTRCETIGQSGCVENVSFVVSFAKFYVWKMYHL